MTTVTETMTFPGSSSLSEATYDPSTETLTVAFQSGDRYNYFNVPNGVYRALARAGSAGKYFYSNIRNRYSYERD